MKLAGAIAPVLRIFRAGGARIFPVRQGPLHTRSIRACHAAARAAVQAADVEFSDGSSGVR